MTAGGNYEDIDNFTVKTQILKFVVTTHYDTFKILYAIHYMF